MDLRSTRGFSLVELMVAIGIIAILLAIAAPAMLAPKRAAQDTAAQATLVLALKTEETAATDDGIYTSDLAGLAALEPALDWSGVADDSVHVLVGTLGGETQSVLLYTRSNTGTWFGLRQLTATAQRYQCSGAAKTDVDGLADCVGHDW